MAICRNIHEYKNNCRLIFMLRYIASSKTQEEKEKLFEEIWETILSKPEAIEEIFNEYEKKSS